MKPAKAESCGCSPARNRAPGKPQNQGQLRPEAKTTEDSEEGRLPQLHGLPQDSGWLGVRMFLEMAALFSTLPQPRARTHCDTGCEGTGTVQRLHHQLAGQLASSRHQHRCGELGPELASHSAARRLRQARLRAARYTGQCLKRACPTNAKQVGSVPPLLSEA